MICFCFIIIEIWKLVYATEKKKKKIPTLTILTFPMQLQVIKSELHEINPQF